MDYDNNRPFSSEGAVQEHKKKSNLGKGIVIGVVATILVMGLVMSSVFISGLFTAPRRRSGTAARCGRRGICR